MTTAQPGTPVKVQEDANLPHNYTLPPNTAVSRFIYVSESLSGESRPVSGYILWPYMPRLDANGGNQVVAWAHGTSGTTVSTAPSKFKNLWNHFIAPYQLVLQGYVVVATNYAGLGVGVATDVVYSVQAARKAFPQISESFVVLGNSQGGGATWGVTQKHAVSNIPGYLGAIAISPATSDLDGPEPFGSLIAATMAPGIETLCPKFDYNDFFTPEGLEMFNEIVKLDCASSITIPMLLTLAGNLLKADWVSSEWLLKYDNLTANGERKISGPLLVIQGDNDPMVNSNNTIKKNLGLHLISLLHLTFNFSASQGPHIPLLLQALKEYGWVELQIDLLEFNFNLLIRSQVLLVYSLPPEMCQATYQN